MFATLLCFLHITAALSAATPTADTDALAECSPYHHTAKTPEADKGVNCAKSFHIGQDGSSFSIKNITNSCSCDLFAKFYKPEVSPQASLAKFTYVRKTTSEPPYVSKSEVFYTHQRYTTKIFFKKGDEEWDNLQHIDFLVGTSLPASDDKVSILPSSEADFAETFSVKVFMPITWHCFFIFEFFPQALSTIHFYSGPDEIHLLKLSHPKVPPASPYTLPLTSRSLPCEPINFTGSDGSITIEIPAHKEPDTICTRLTAQQGTKRKVISITAPKNVTWGDPKVTLAQCTYTVYSDEQQVASDTVTIYGITDVKQNKKLCAARIDNDSHKFQITSCTINYAEDIKTETMIDPSCFLRPTANQSMTASCILALPHTKVRYTASLQGLTVKDEASPCSYSLAYTAEHHTMRLQKLTNWFIK